jgi:hypothetical protein
MTGTSQIDKRFRKGGSPLLLCFQMRCWLFPILISGVKCLADFLPDLSDDETSLDEEIANEIADDYVLGVLVL